MGHTKGYIQVLVNAPESLLGSSATVRITSVGRWSVFGEVIQVLSYNAQDRTLNKDELSCSRFSPSGVSDESCACSKDPDSCCSAAKCADTSEVPINSNQGKDDQNFDGPWKRNSLTFKASENTKFQEPNPEEQSGKARARASMAQWNIIDKSLVAGIFLSFLIAVACFSQLWARKVMSS